MARAAKAATKRIDNILRRFQRVRNEGLGEMKVGKVPMLDEGGIDKRCARLDAIYKE